MKFSKFTRETATEIAALPHRFDSQDPRDCQVCHTPVEDLRHLAWERQQLADRERAAAEIKREIGS